MTMLTPGIETTDPRLAVGRLGERRLRLFFDCSSVVGRVVDCSEFVWQPSESARSERRGERRDPPAVVRRNASVCGLAVLGGPRGEERSPTNGHDPGVLARAPGDQATTTAPFDARMADEVAVHGGGLRSVSWTRNPR